MNIANPGQILARIEEINDILASTAKLREEKSLLNKLLVLLDPEGEHKEPVTRRLNTTPWVRRPEGYQTMPEDFQPDNNEKRRLTNWNRSERNRLEHDGIQCAHCHTWVLPSANSLSVHTYRLHPGLEPKAMS